MIARALRFTNFSFLLLFTGCTALAPLLATPASDPPPQPTSTPQPIITQTMPSASEARILRVWLPPQFDPAAGTPSANMLKQRLADFEAEHPGLEMDIRIKAEEGEANLLNSLSITNIAAPSALPDLIALTRHSLEAAALKGLLHPIDGLSTALDDANWYAYARQLAHIQNTGYGLPFAGDALVLIHHPEVKAPRWEELLSMEEPVAFFAGDPRGLIGLSLYVSSGGRMLDEHGAPILEEEALQRVLTLMSAGVEANVFSPTLLNFETDQQALQAYQDGSANIALIWAAGNRGNGVFQPIPSQDTPHTFADGWVWALAGSNPENQQAAVELAEYLSEGEFISEWTPEAGYLPTRPSSVGESEANINSILESAQVIPSEEALSILGPLIQEALVRVLNGEQPEAVARSVIEKLK